MILLGDHFSSDDRSRHSEWLRRQQWFIKARQENHRKDEVSERLDDEFLSIAAEAIIATEIQIAEFEARIDAYEARIDAFEAKLDAQDVAILNALTDNQLYLDQIDRLLGEVELRLQDLLAQAYILEDGRRVFRSEDGTFVIDEFGEDVSRDEVDFDLVTGPPAQIYMKELASKNSLIEDYSAASEQRKQLHLAQDKLDEARVRISGARDKIRDVREKIAEGDLTVDELEDLDAELLDAMPPSTLPTLPASAMKHLSGIENAANTPNAKTTFATSANPASMVPSTTPVLTQVPAFDPMR